MKKIQLYSDDGVLSMEFAFNDPDISYNINHDWIVIDAAGRTITLSGTSMLAYDEEIVNSRILLDWSVLWKTEINDAYKDSEKILVIFSSKQNPIMLFRGKSLGFISDVNGLTHFLMDDKPIWLYHMNYLILSKK